jgi:hypothetical protein
VNRSLLRTAAFLLASCGIGLSLADAAPAQRRPVRNRPPAAKPPETSADSSFRPEKITKLAVLVVGESRPGYSGGLGSIGSPRASNDGLSDQQRLVEDEFVQALLQKGYSIASRSDVAAIVKEQGFQRNSGLTESDAARIGKVLNVPAVLIVRVTEASTQSEYNAAIRKQQTQARASMGARLINVETASVWWIGKHSNARLVSGRNAVNEVVAEVAKAIATAFPDKPK